ncbi:uncharacterized protein at3g06530 [Phtheirospermum japonicum]|uniref:Uncharacterized protein at3g06530 n=1 Tax=Phtheirospermum japonicum TaxID=374723 RepID=A0A830B8C4_9LAMI|nr:uncharacterized protein at3g06530 [Phtheirospermum japonicum]
MLLRLRCSAAAGGCSSLLLRCANPFDNYNRMMSTVSSVDVDKSGTPRISPPQPWLMQPPDFNKGGGGMFYNFYNLADEKRESFPKTKRTESESEFEELPDDDSKFVGSSHGWLALLNPRNNNLFLSNPITGRHIKLPSIQTSLPNPEINFRGIVSKLILTCSPDEDECRAFVIFGPEDRLAFCHPRRRSTKWIPLGNLYYEDKGTWRYSDLVYSSRRKLLFCVAERVLECWSLRDKFPRICWSQWIPLLGYYDGFEMYSVMVGYGDVRAQSFLVFSEQFNQLFLLQQHVASRIRPDGSYPTPTYFSKYRGWDHGKFPYQTVDFEIHKVVDWDDNEEGEKKLRCIYMKSSLDGLAMFVGMNHSFAISADEFPELKQQLEPDCIYFTDTNKHPRPAGSFYGGHDIGIFNYRNKTFTPCVYPREVKKIERIVPAPMWFTPTLYPDHTHLKDMLFLFLRLSRAMIEGKVTLFHARKFLALVLKVNLFRIYHEDFLAAPVKKIQLSKHVIGFCIAVIVEVLGLATVDSDTVKSILPYVSSKLQHGARGLRSEGSSEFEELLNSSLLMKALQNVLQRCIDIFLSSSLTNSHVSSNTDSLCLQQVITNFKDQEQYAMALATTIFPLLLIRPRTMVGELVEQLVYHLQLVVTASIKTERKDYIRAILRTLTKTLLPSTYFKATTKLFMFVTYVLVS